jgi:hypothetical protein
MKGHHPRKSAAERQTALVAVYSVPRVRATATKRHVRASASATATRHTTIAMPMKRSNSRRTKARESTGRFSRSPEPRRIFGRIEYDSFIAITGLGILFCEKISDQHNAMNFC